MLRLVHTDFTSWSVHTHQTRRVAGMRTAKKKDRRQQQLFAASRMRTTIALCVQTGGGKAGFPLTRMEPSLSSTKQAPFLLHNRASGRGSYISYGRNLQTCLSRPEWGRVRGYKQWYQKEQGKFDLLSDTKSRHRFLQRVRRYGQWRNRLCLS